MNAHWPGISGMATDAIEIDPTALRCIATRYTIQYTLVSCPCGRPDSNNLILFWKAEWHNLRLKNNQMNRQLAEKENRSSPDRTRISLSLEHQNWLRHKFEKVKPELTQSQFCDAIKTNETEIKDRVSREVIQNQVLYCYVIKDEPNILWCIVTSFCDSRGSFQSWQPTQTPRPKDKLGIVWWFDRFKLAISRKTATHTHTHTLRLKVARLLIHSRHFHHQ
jgi:hypothetical protein